MREFLATFRAGGLPATAALEIGRTRFYQIYADYLRACAARTQRRWQPGASGGDHARLLGGRGRTPPAHAPRRGSSGQLPLHRQRGRAPPRLRFGPGHRPPLRSQPRPRSVKARAQRSPKGRRGGGEQNLLADFDFLPPTSLARSPNSAKPSTFTT